MNKDVFDPLVDLGHGCMQQKQLVSTMNDSTIQLLYQIVRDMYFFFLQYLDQTRISTCKKNIRYDQTYRMLTMRPCQALKAVK